MKWRSEQRFWAKVRKTDSCWLWQGAKAGVGYGNFSHDGKNIYAHRYSMLLHGRLVDDLVVDHICRNRLCVNPDHLRMATYQTNTRENSISPAGINASKTQCNSGHEFTEQNTRYRTDAAGIIHRSCRTCGRLSKRKVNLTDDRVEHLYSVQELAAMRELRAQGMKLRKIAEQMNENFHNGEPVRNENGVQRKLKRTAI